jgi:cation:H+ antiporter
MILIVVKLVVGLGLLTWGADIFVRGAAALALRLGVSSLVVGLTVVAMGTSAPELLVCVQAAIDGRGSLAMGNAVGSNIFNTGAILGAAALVYPMRCAASVIRREVPSMIGVGAVLTLAALFGLQAGMIDRREGIVLLVLFAGYLIYSYRSARMGTREVQTKVDIEFTSREAERMRAVPLWRTLAYLVVGATLLAVGARLLVDAAVAVAMLLGVSELVIGLTVVGAGTGLPELATSLAAAVRRHSDIAIGNVVGSNIFNVLLILGTTAVVRPLEVERSVVVRDLPVMMAFFVLCFPIMLTRGRIGRGEGALLLGMYLGYVALLYYQSTSPA